MSCPTASSTSEAEPLLFFFNLYIILTKVKEQNNGSGPENEQINLLCSEILPAGLLPASLHQGTLKPWLAPI